jgi:hypothetical protein
MRWEVRGLCTIKSRLDISSSMMIVRRHEACDAMVRSDPAWVELYEIEAGKEPKRLRRYELPRMVGKMGRR